MFTGIIEARGTVLRVVHNKQDDSAVLSVHAGDILKGLGLGGSLAVNGVCLTAVRLDRGTIEMFVMGETLRRTTTGELRAGEHVNLERCVPAGGRLDGHVVQGHVDGMGQLLEREDLGRWERLRFSAPGDLGQFIAEKGSIAVDGVSLTVTAVSRPREAEQWFEVGLIPATLERTVLGERAVGDRVNLEVDVLAKYAQRLLAFAGARQAQP